jgi:hypothetical protein
MESVDILPPEKVAFITHNIGIYELDQKFGGLITTGRITYGTGPSKVELLSESNPFYDAEMMSEIMNAILQRKKGSAMVMNQ